MPFSVGRPATVAPLRIQRRATRTLVSLVVLAVLAVGLAAPGPAGGAERVALSGSAPLATTLVDPAPVVGSTGVGDPYFPLAGNGGYDALRYDVHVRWAFTPRHLRGWTQITARATRDLRAFHLDLLLPATRVRVGGRDAAFRRVHGPAGPRGAAHELRVRPVRTIPAGTVFRVAVRYGGRPGAVRWNGMRHLRATDTEVLALDEPHIAPWWFPSSDHPSDKARIDVHLTVPRGRQAVSGGLLTGITGRGAWRTWHWRSPEPMATYLAFFAAGRFQIERGTSGGRPFLHAVSHRLPPARRAASLRLLRRTPEVVDWLAARLGPYPFSATGGVVTGIRVGFALETQSRPVYPEVTPGDIDLLVHEQAHQWFGDSVSVHRWRDIWLNEGFATWLEQHWHEAHGGPTARRWLRRSYDELRGDPGFWRVRIGDPGRRHLFAWAVYQRGAMTVEALRGRIGEDAFWSVLRTWLESRADGNGAVTDFVTLAEDVSGQDLDAFFEAWLHADRPPADVAELGLGPDPSS